MYSSFNIFILLLPDMVAQTNTAFKTNTPIEIIILKIMFLLFCTKYSKQETVNQNFTGRLQFWMEGARGAVLGESQRVRRTAGLFPPSARATAK